MWADARNTRDLISQSDSLRAVAENQRVTLNPILINNSCRGYEVAWLTRCGKEAESCDDTAASESCDLSGDELSSAKATYEVTNCVHDSFTVWDDDCNGLFSYEEKVARGFMECEKNITAALNKAAISFLGASDQDSVFAPGNGIIVPGVGTYYPEAEWDVSLMKHFAAVAMHNYIADPILLSGNNLWGAQFDARYNFLNDDQRDQAAKLGHFRNWYWDPINLDVTLGTDSTIMFDAGAVAFLTKHEYQNAAPMNMQDSKNTFVNSMPAMNLTYRDGNGSKPVMFDVLSQVVCKTLAGGILKFGRVFKVICRYEFLLSPEDCAGNSGIIQFIKGVAPEPAPE